MTALDILRERGFIKQVSHEEELAKLFANERVTAYVGYDPTADSLTVGHLVPTMALSHLQRAGHRVIAVIGGGTTMVGDPTDKTEMRSLLSRGQIKANGERFKQQLSKILDLSSEDKGIFVDNADWLLELNYVNFLREIGVHFSVNRMLAAECYRARLEREEGLTFLEFNYMLMQSYDFLELNRRYGCKVQMGGDDQWSNILSGADLIRRKEGREAFAMTFPLLMTSDGRKMGKTASGAVWLDPEKTTPYEFYQYWRNTTDADVERFAAMFTHLPMDEVRRLGAATGAEINESKRRLAFEVTKIVHGEAEARKAQAAADALFSGEGDLEAAPTTFIPAAELVAALNIVDLLVRTELAPSKSEARRLIAGGGIQINGDRVETSDRMITEADFRDGVVMLRKGKKGWHRVVRQ
ncbi:MAG: tyrosine--tRNA ligase [Chloroflexota bacterium]